jgi:hypothetical protein
MMLYTGVVGVWSCGHAPLFSSEPNNAFSFPILSLEVLPLYCGQEALAALDGCLRIRVKSPGGGVLLECVSSSFDTRSLRQLMCLGCSSISGLSGTPLLERKLGGSKVEVSSSFSCTACGSSSTRESLGA